MRISLRATLDLIKTSCQSQHLLNVRREGDAKLIAFYLPQFHTIPLNDKSYGRGFTEWTNVTRAIPHFTGHYQPRLPIDVGFYDLSHDDVMYRQIELAKMYGLYGFCFYYYWFSGTRLLEKPLFNYLHNKDLDFPFCLSWANENWSKLWDGGNKEIIMEQKNNDGDCECFFYDILPFFNDRRYIKISGKPVLMIYQPQLFSKEEWFNWVSLLRKLAKENGFEDLFLMSRYQHERERPEDVFLDAFFEFPPRNIKFKPKTVAFCNPLTSLKVYDMEEYVEKKYWEKTFDFKLFHGVFPSWDSTARKAYSEGSVFHGLSPEKYRDWLSSCIQLTKSNHHSSERFVFINAWNEWAEGAHLEPDQRYGYAYLQATKEAVEKGCE